MTTQTTERIALAFEMRVSDPDKREIEGLAVPYGQDIDLGGWTERVEKGAFAGAEAVPLFWSHDHRSGGMPIGTTTELREARDGLHIKARISKTGKGDEAYELVKDGVVRHFSVGFDPIESRMDGDTIVRTLAKLREVSVTHQPAYEDAAIEAVRSTAPAADTPTDTTSAQTGEPPPMPETTTLDADVAELREAVDEITRSVALISTEREPEVTAQYRSLGEMAKAALTEPEKVNDFVKAIAETRSFSGTTTGDLGSTLKNGWVGDLVRLVDHGRPLMNFFGRDTLPAEGNSVEYAELASNTIAAADQGGEGEALVTGKVVLTTKTATVKTYAGATEAISRQTIERSSVPYLDKVFRALAIGYGAVTEAKVKSVLEGGPGYNTGSIESYASGAIMAALAQAVVDVHQDLGMSLDGLVIGPDAWVAFAALEGEDGRPLLNVAGQPVNQLGSINVAGMSANVGGIPVTLAPALSPGYVYFASREGLSTWESSGAPVSLSDEDITHLTREFSVYGYLASAVTIPKAIVKIALPDDESA